MAPRGYCWWYVDALSDDGRFALTLIAFVGSVFSPYYAWARRGGRAADPEHFCCLNVALHGPGAGRWAMTERGRSALRRDATTLALGPSRVAWDGAALTVDIDERGMPTPRRVRGTVRVHPEALTRHTEVLDTHGRHRWSPISPRARVEVALEAPALRWSGTGYLDSNDGDGPLEESFADWTWSRAPLRDGTAILYDARRRDGSDRNVAIRIDRAGRVEPFASPPAEALPRTFWGIPRATRAEPGGAARLDRTLLDAPFYARSVATTRLLGQDVATMHEALSLDRFRAPWVQAMLPFRMPRIG